MKLKPLTTGLGDVLVIVGFLDLLDVAREKIVSQFISFKKYLNNPLIKIEIIN